MANSELYLQETTSGSWRPMLSTDLKASSVHTTASPMFVSGVPEQKQFSVHLGGVDDFSHSVLAKPGTLYYVNLETWQPDGLGNPARFDGRGKIEFQNNVMSAARNVIAFDVSGNNNYTFAPGVGVKFNANLNIVSKNLGDSKAWRVSLIVDSK
jgi:hypothetical protein